MPLHPADFQHNTTLPTYNTVTVLFCQCRCRLIKSHRKTRRYVCRCRWDHINIDQPLQPRFWCWRETPTVPARRAPSKSCQASGRRLRVGAGMSYRVVNEFARLHRGVTTCWRRWPTMTTTRSRIDTATSSRAAGDERQSPKDKLTPTSSSWFGCCGCSHADSWLIMSYI